MISRWDFRLMCLKLEIGEVAGNEWRRKTQPNLFGSRMADGNLVQKSNLY
jgi:hypothetical protein